MGRKGKRRAKQRRASELPAIKTESAEAVEQQSNVIQFRAKTSVAHGASQVAVNDDVTTDAPTSRREPSEARRIEEDLTTENDRPSEPHAMDAETSPGTLDAAPEAMAAPALAEPAEAATEEASDEQAEAEAEREAGDETAEAATAGEAEAHDAAEADEEAAPEETAAVAASDTVTEASASSETSEEPAAAPVDEPVLDRASGIEEKAPEVEAETAEPVAAVAVAQKVAQKEEEAEEKPAAKADDKGERKRRPKAEGTTSSATIRALTITGEHPMVAEDFFRAPNYEAQREETWDDLKKVVEPLPPGVKRARMATYWIGGTAAVAIGGWLLYSKVFSVQPDPEVGGIRVADLPDVASISAAMNEAAPETAPREAAVPAETAMEEVAEATETAEATEAETAETTEAETAETTEAETAETTEAETAAETPVEAEPAPPTGEYATLLAEAQRLRGRRAEEAYRAAIAANPNGVEALAPLAFSLLNRRQNQEAADLAARAVAVDATNSQAWITLGAARQELRDAAGARQAYQSCVDQGQGRYVSDCRLMLQSMR
jgi:hypothetical protein